MMDYRIEILPGDHILRLVPTDGNLPLMFKGESLCSAEIVPRSEDGVRVKGRVWGVLDALGRRTLNLVIEIQVLYKEEHHIKVFHGTIPEVQAAMDNYAFRMHDFAREAHGPSNMEDVLNGKSRPQQLNRSFLEFTSTLFDIAGVSAYFSPSYR
jgi:hypothetical protein